MSLAEEARRATARRGPRCQTCLLLETPIGPELQEALDDEGLQFRAISAALKARGIHLGDQSMSRHKRGLCDGAA